MGTVKIVLSVSGCTDEELKSAMEFLWEGDTLSTDILTSLNAQGVSPENDEGWGGMTLTVEGEG
jgi:hypothetical protein